ncbi:recombinase family protein [Methylomonas rapida]|uniref:Recombinase family protein n=1 Tax=Methylomonas rapida TaxID=2963939 RepID=A0ABY7GNV6_9GAMM|nr:recombinase family protein [Methylomonas rapida]WAR46191.1 recombinase family protein [Methylomonas rapida]
MHSIRCRFTPQLKAAIEACRKHKATLVIAKLDRLARNVHFIPGLLETGMGFVVVDMPQANRVMHSDACNLAHSDISKP